MSIKVRVSGFSANAVKFLLVIRSMPTAKVINTLGN